MICEKCQKVIGKATKEKVEYSVEVVKCKACKAEYCVDCASKMVKCFCCGEEFTQKK